MTGHLILTVPGIVLLSSVALSAGEPTPAQLARSTEPIPPIRSVPVLKDEELTYERLKALLQSKSYVDRFTGVRNLARCSGYGWKGTPQQAGELAALALRDSYWAVRYEAAQFAYPGRTDGEGIIPALVAALDSEEPLVRAQVALALQRNGGVDEALPQLKKMLAAADQPLAAATALADTETGRKILVELAISSNATTRLFSNAGLVHAGDDTANAAIEPYLKELRAALTSKDAATTIQGCKSVDLSASKAAGAGREIAALLSHADLGIRLAAAQAILYSAPQDDAVVSAIIKVLDDKEIGIQCIATLGPIGEKARPAIPSLIRLMDQDPLRQYVVIRALPGIDPQSPDTLAALLKVLKTSVNEGHPSTDAIEALGGYGPAAKAAVPDLMRAMDVKGKAPYYVPASIWTLGQIGPDAAEARSKVEKYLRSGFQELAATALKRITAKDPATMPAPQQRYPGPSVDF